MIRSTAIISIAGLLAACAGNPKADLASDTAYADQVEGQLIPAVAEADELSVCEPEVSDQRVALDDQCINRIDTLPYEGKRYNAIGREIKEQKSLCDYMFLPRCRKKY